MKPIDPQLAQFIQETINAAITRERANAPTANFDELAAGFKAQIDAHARNAKLEITEIASTMAKRADETDDLVSKLMAQIADLEIRLRKYMDGDRYSITKRQVARLMRDHNG